MAKKKSNISEASSYAEIGEFWDNNDLADFWEKGKEVDTKFDIKEQVILYGLSKELSDKIESIARDRKVPARAFLHEIMQAKLTEF